MLNVRESIADHFSGIPGVGYKLVKPIEYFDELGGLLDKNAYDRTFAVNPEPFFQLRS